MPDPFENTVCVKNDAAYETLPLIDGNRHSGVGIIAGVRITRNGKEIPIEKMSFSDSGNGKAKVDYGNFMFLLKNDSFTVSSESDFNLEYRFCKDVKELPVVLSLSERELRLEYQKTLYGIRLDRGLFASSVSVRSENGQIEVSILRIR